VALTFSFELLRESAIGKRFELLSKKTLAYPQAIELPPQSRRHSLAFECDGGEERSPICHASEQFYSPHHAADVPGEQHALLDAGRGIYQYDRLIVLNSTNSPAVLFEAGIIVNRADELLLASDDRRKVVSDALADAVLEYCKTP
jgi:hypothetical protein